MSPKPTRRERLIEWREAAATLQSLAVALAAVAGAVWAAYSFWAQKEARRAGIELSVLETLNSNALMEVTIAVHQAPSEGSAIPLIIDVTLSQRGTRSVLVNFSGNHLGVSQVRHDSTYPRGASRRLASPAIIRLHPSSIVGVGPNVILPGVQRVLSYLVFVKQPGLYHIDFEVSAIMLEPGDRKALARIGPMHAGPIPDSLLPPRLVDPRQRLSIVSAKYVVVE